MTFASIQIRFDEFQEQAVLATLSDFRKKPKGRYLLVIPTGGGKTFTAVKVVNQLFSEGLLKEKKDRVMWVAHREELLRQARGTFCQFSEIYKGRRSFVKSVDFKMLKGAVPHLKGNKNIKLIIIDEAQHGAANSYQPFFSDPRVGILGLTATPTRHDGLPLEFEQESYSIGFPDLVRMGVILRPEVHSVSGGRFEINDLGDKGQLEIINDKSRNNRILKAIVANIDIYEKIIIYTGTNKHAEDLCKLLQESELQNHYQSISYIAGNKNSRNEPRKDFLQKEQSWKRSIIVNVNILSEGYDDPRINTVIVAAPTRSKLRYMQAIGRAVRRDSNNDLKRAFIVEIEDELPNIKYRIDNRWLYADISDALEPAVEDIEYESIEALEKLLKNTYANYDVESKYRIIPKLVPENRYSLLLFKVYLSENKFTHFPLLIDNNNQLQIRHFFNFLSERMLSYVEREINAAQALKMANVNSIELLKDQEPRKRVFEAMRNSVSTDKSVVNYAPWITFVTFRIKRRSTFISDDLMEFINSLVNKDEIIESILERAYMSGSVLIRLPLPLNSYIGRIQTAKEFQAIQKTIKLLEELKQSYGNTDHRMRVVELMDSQIIPLEFGHANSLVTIVREGVEFFKKLE